MIKKSVKKIFNLALILMLFSTIAFAQSEKCIPQPIRKPEYKKEIDNYIDSKLKLSSEQKHTMDIQRKEHIKDIEKIIDLMEKDKLAIRNIYLTGIPKWQADLRSAKYKADLVVLKQNALDLKQKHRKTFESLLTEEQKIEFQKIKVEFAKKNPNICQE